jgi:antitoxin (DNA-binding transcriptional repressor) of toxin-antitoxin stability system
MKTAKKRADAATISTHEMRFQFSRVLRAVSAGRSLMLTYRNRPLPALFR